MKLISTYLHWFLFIHIDFYLFTLIFTYSHWFLPIHIDFYLSKLGNCLPIHNDFYLFFSKLQKCQLSMPINFFGKVKNIYIFSQTYFFTILNIFSTFYHYKHSSFEPITIFWKVENILFSGNLFFSILNIFRKIELKKSGHFWEGGGRANFYNFLIVFR